MVAGVTLAVAVEVGVGVGVAPPCSSPLPQPAASRLTIAAIMRIMNANLFISYVSFLLNSLFIWNPPLFNYRTLIKSSPEP